MGRLRDVSGEGQVAGIFAGVDWGAGADAEEDAVDHRAAWPSVDLSEQKTRVIEFGRFAGENRAGRGLAKPETFDFLGFTHIAGKDRNGRFQLKRRSSRKKRRAKLAQLKEECARRRHEHVKEQHAWLRQVLTGQYRYYGVPTNYQTLAQFRRRVRAIWHWSLSRRSQRGRWRRAYRDAFDERFPLPQPRIHHPWPEQRFALR